MQGYGSVTSSDKDAQQRSDRTITVLRQTHATATETDRIADAVNMELEEQGQLLMRSADNVNSVDNIIATTKTTLSSWHARILRRKGILYAAATILCFVNVGLIWYMYDHDGYL